MGTPWEGRQRLKGKRKVRDCAGLKGTTVSGCDHRPLRRATAEQDVLSCGACNLAA